jgi:hypothetical protein
MVGLFILGPVWRSSPIDRVLVDARTARERVARASAICVPLSSNLSGALRGQGRCGSKAALREALPTGSEAVRAHPVGLWEEL